MGFQTVPGSAPDTGVEVDTDVVIVGAGISGIGAAYRITERNPGIRYVVLERRERIGGTWDLFRYPGVRSDSSIFTLCLPYEPWTRDERVGDGARIREYLTETARKYGIDEHIRFGHRVVAADWDPATDTWTVTAESRGADGVSVTRTLRSRFVFFGSGYYNYDEPYRPDFPGIEAFRGEVVHPQYWPEDLDYAGKDVVVIGSGATAVSLVPAMARTAHLVTMLQRTPTYLISASRYSRYTTALRRVLPLRWSQAVLRMYFALMEWVLWIASQGAPGMVRRALRRQAVRNLPPGYDVDADFKPPYQPWDQRLCLIPDADLYTAIADGLVRVVTDHIERFDATGITLRSGAHLDADIVVTATGFQLQALGGVRISVGGEPVDPCDRFAYKAHMIDRVPNLFWCLGYTNASWTLRADMTARATARLIEYLREHRYTHAYPRLEFTPSAEQPAWDLKSNYVLRGEHALPRSAKRRPWKVRQNYVADALDHRFDRITESMVFGRAGDREPIVG